MRVLRRSQNTSLSRGLIAATGAGLLFLTACGSDSTGTAAPVAATTQAPAGAAALNIENPWVKTAAEKMTAAFGMIDNTGTVPLTIISAKTSASSRTELHEVIETDGKTVMQPKEGGFTIPAGGKLELKPGGAHIMIMDLQNEVAAGDQVTLQLTLADGTTKEFTALAKATTAGEENYESDGEMDMDKDMSSATATATP